MPGIFISYRRSDASAEAGRLYDSLATRFGEANVFRDVDTLRGGVDWVENIDSAVSSVDAFVAVIGPDWFGVEGERGGSRLLDENDYVRLEIAAALRRSVYVVPVLVRGASVPDAGLLPDDLKSLVRLQAVELTDRRWRVDVDALEESLSSVVRPVRRSRLLKRLVLAGSVVAALALILGLLFTSDRARLFQAEGRGTVLEKATVETSMPFRSYLQSREKVADVTRTGFSPEELAKDVLIVEFDVEFDGAKDAGYPFNLILEQRKGKSITTIEQRDKPYTLDADNDGCGCSDYFFIPDPNASYRVIVEMYRPNARDAQPLQRVKSGWYRPSLSRRRQ